MNILLLALCLFLLPAVAAEAQNQAPLTQEGFASLAPGIENEGFFDPFAEVEELDIQDPLEPLNRGMFWVNDKVYSYALEPAARAYRLVPERARVSVGNFFSNMATPIRFANDIYQLEFKAAGMELGRFVVNSTVGVAGLFDPASAYGWHREDDFDQVLEHYGAGSGLYLVLPILGPSTARDVLGRVIDLLYDPVSQAVADNECTLSLDLDTYAAIKEQALDPYLCVRDAFVQRRQVQKRVQRTLGV
jgi:phospholipid-binding lipoprotein MlaA